ncbi:DUF397 domain-containing protein [Actinocrispum wychmicini]|uniref:DUF397 domain-containing protein n=1 Tax=Actinocrispum wychmicini TaxID=1213861 RepID=UPI0010456797|nr:DUF397 domain-containing protein [Actinocrispum wychmicini]
MRDLGSGSDTGRLSRAGVWHKSVCSGSAGSNCVEVKHGQESVLVRDSKGDSAVWLRFSRVAWFDFRWAVRRNGDR